MAGANAATGNGLMAELRLGRVERPFRWLRERAARTRAEQLARMTWTDAARLEHLDRSQDSRESGSNSLRWARLV